MLADASPTKGFFINMLTRDIELNDAILDLLDNCLDGVVRIRKAQKVERHSSDFYRGYQAEIIITDTSFCIQDNCGGIPIEIARKYAFRMGRDDTSPVDETATVGIYGIGMKRAIFKIGRSAQVHSITKDKAFEVVIPKDWALKTDSWDFDIISHKNDNTKQTGTKVIIKDLNDSIRALWTDEGHRNTFVLSLINHIKESYSLIIQRGFTVTVNGINVEPNEVSFIFSNDKNGIKPFVYKNKIGNVNIRMAVGFYAAPPSIDESDKMAEVSGQRSSKDAGWTVICNDRVVLYNNKDHLTGWGENSVPKYHPQFIGIRGIVEFESVNPEELPMTTTKRGVDLASPVYAAAKKKMCEGLKLFTSFTNNWKGTANSDTKYFAAAEHLNLDDLVRNESTTEIVELPKKIDMSPTRDGGKQFKPRLPKRDNTSDVVYVRYAVKSKECDMVARYVFEDEEEHTPSEVGEECYKNYLIEARKIYEEV